MNSQDAIQQELNELRSSLPPDRQQPVFTVPEGYFENLAASVLAKAKSQPAESAADELQALSPVLAAIPKTQPFSVPEAYFTDLATSLPALVNDEALPDVLQTHTKQMPYQVPTHYFDGLAAQVAAKVAGSGAKVVSMRPRFMRMMAAAVIAGGVLIGGVFYLKSGNTVDPAKQSGAWVAQKLKNVPQSEIEAFLKTVDTGFNSKELAQKSSSDVRQMLRDVSTTDLDAFLSELPADGGFSNMN